MMQQPKALQGGPGQPGGHSVASSVAKQLRAALQPVPSPGHG